MRKYHPEVNLSLCPSYLTNKEYSKLLDLVIDNGFDSYMEIGVMKGGNLVRMSNLFAINNYKCKITAYDCFAELAPVDPNNTHTSGFQPIDSVKDTIKYYGYKVEFIQALAKNAREVLPDGTKYDVVFHDADHSFEGVYEDLKAIRPFVRDNGYVCVHDIIYDKERDAYGGGAAVSKLIKEGAYDLLEIVDSMGVLRLC